MVARAQAGAGSDICVLADAEIVLLPEFAKVLTRLSKVDRDWFLVAMSRNTASFNYQPSHSGSFHRIQKEGEEMSFEKVPFRKQL